MTSLEQFTHRVRHSAVAWSWLMNALRLGSGIILLPLLVGRLSKPDFDLYFVFLSLSALVSILDLGFSVSIGRAVSFAMGGAQELQPQGLAATGTLGAPNHELLVRLLHTCRQLYRLLTLVALVLVCGAGTAFIATVIPQSTSPALAWAAWGLTVASILWDIYSGWWNVFLRHMDQVLESTRQMVFAQAVKLALAGALLLAGGGLLSVPLATLAASFLQRHLARRSVRRRLAEIGPASGASLLGTLWPNSWRAGLQFFSGYLAGQANTLVCLPLLGLAAGGSYGFSLQLATLCASMAQVWTAVKWPLIGQLRVQQNLSGLRRMFWPRVWLQYLTYLVLALFTVLAVPAWLAWAGSDKHLLPAPWLALLALQVFLDMNYSLWGTLISTENRAPYTWPIILTNLSSFLLVLVLLATTQLGVGALVLAPLAANSLCNYWKWPRDGARSVGCAYWAFLLRRPPSAVAGAAETRS
jgi:hypothetical protein